MGGRRPSPRQPRGRLWALLPSPPTPQAAKGPALPGTVAATTRGISTRSDEIKSAPRPHAPRLEAQPPRVASGPTQQTRPSSQAVPPGPLQPPRSHVRGLIPGSATVGLWARDVASPCLSFPTGQELHRCPARSKEPTGRAREHHNPTPPVRQDPGQVPPPTGSPQAFLSSPRHLSLNQRSLST